MANKQSDLLRLAKVRQSTRWFGYKSIGDYHGGVYECDFVSPYTKTAGNINADVMVMLQDWSSDDSLSCHRLGDECKYDDDSATLGFSQHWPTTRNLIRLLEQAFKLTLPTIYATNLFPFIKLGEPSAKIPPEDLVKAAREFGLPQIRIVRPKLVICLGIETFNALRQACGLGADLDVDSAIQNPFDLANSETRIWCQSHTGHWGPINRNRGNPNRVSEDWLRMKEDFVARFGDISVTSPESGSTSAYFAVDDDASADTNHGLVPPAIVQVVPTYISSRKIVQAGQQPCRVIAVTSNGEMIHSTPELHSRPDLRQRIVSHQRGRLEKKHPSLKTRRDVLYKLEWLVDGKWIADETV